MRQIPIESRGEFDELIKAGWHHQSHIMWDDAVMTLILLDLDEDLEASGLEVVVCHSVQDPGMFVYRIEQRA